MKFPAKNKAGEDQDVGYYARRIFHGACEHLLLNQRRARATIRMDSDPLFSMLGVVKIESCEGSPELRE